MVIIYTIAGVTGFLLSSFMGALSADSVLAAAARSPSAPRRRFSACSARWCITARRGGSSMVQSEAMGYAVTLFVFGLIMPGVDNAAHAGGFVGGYLAGMWLDPLKRERMDHFVGAAICLLATSAHWLATVHPAPAVPTVRASVIVSNWLMRKPVVLITGAGGEIGHGLIDRLARARRSRASSRSTSRGWTTRSRARWIAR